MKVTWNFGQKQIEEKQRMEAERKERLRLEEEKEEKRLAEEREQMQRQFEKEQEKERRKETEVCSHVSLTNSSESSTCMYSIAGAAVS